MVKNIKLKAWDASEAACPAIKKQVEQLQLLQSKPLKLNSDVIVLHPNESPVSHPVPHWGYAIHHLGR